MKLVFFYLSLTIFFKNQLLNPNKSGDCEQCNARSKMQQKYLDQILELYEDFHIVQIPQLTNEVRGVPTLKEYVFGCFNNLSYYC